MGHVRLETECLWPIYALQQVQHFSPTVHAAPANLSFGSQSLAELFCDFTRFGKGLNNLPLIRLRVFGPVPHTGSRIDAHNAIRTRSGITQLFRDAASLADLLNKFLAFLVAAHGRAPASGRPHRRDD